MRRNLRTCLLFLWSFSVFGVFVCAFQRIVLLLVYQFLSALAAEPSLTLPPSPSLCSSLSHPLSLPLSLPLLSPPASLTPLSLPPLSPSSLPHPPPSHTPRMFVLRRLKSVRPPTLLEWSAPSPLRIGPPIKSSVLCRQVQGKVSIWSRPDLLLSVPPFVLALSLLKMAALSPCAAAITPRVS